MNRDTIERGVVLAVMLAVAVVAGWAALETQRTQTNVYELAESHVAMSESIAVRERIVDLPDDSKTYYVTLFLHDNWRTRPEQRAMVAAWDSDPRLRSIKSQVRFNIYTQSDPLYQTKFRASHPVLPAVVVQDQAGKVYSKVSGADATDTEKVAGPLLNLWRSRPIYVLPWRRPKPCPEPGPCPTPDEPDETPDFVPDTAIPDVQPAASLPIAWMIVAALVGGIVAVVSQVKTAFVGDGAE
jgi:hypothetical protein